MSKDNNQEVFPKTSINWEITCYDKTSSNVYFIRNFA